MQLRDRIANAIKANNAKNLPSDVPTLAKEIGFSENEILSCAQLNLNFFSIIVGNGIKFIRLKLVPVPNTCKQNCQFCEQSLASHTAQVLAEIKQNAVTANTDEANRLAMAQKFSDDALAAYPTSKAFTKDHLLYEEYIKPLYLQSSSSAQFTLAELFNVFIKRLDAICCQLNADYGQDKTFTKHRNFMSDIPDDILVRNK